MAHLSEEIASLAADAHKAADENRHAEAVELFAVHLRHFPRDGKTWHRYGYLLRVLGRWKDAENALNKALKLRGDHPNIFVQLAMLYEGLGNRAIAERHFAKACHIYGKDAPGWLWTIRGGNLASLGKFKQAEASHRLALTQPDVELGEAWLNLGYVLRAQRRYCEAVDAFNQAKKHDPTDADVAEAIQSLSTIESTLNRLAGNSQKTMTPQQKKVKRGPKRRG